MSQSKSAIINVRSTPAQRRRLHALAEQRGETLSEYVRGAVDVVAAADGLVRVFEPRSEPKTEDQR